MLSNKGFEANSEGARKHDSSTDSNQKSENLASSKSSMKYVIKRDGKKENFNSSKIVKAVESAFRDVYSSVTPEAGFIANAIAAHVAAINEPKHIEEIQDIVECKLMAYDQEVAREYIRYRHAHEVIRRENTIDKTLMDMLRGESEYWTDENANKNVKVVHTQRDYIAGITSTDITRRLLLPKQIVKAHDAGIIHFHDADYFAQNALNNCCLINLEEMLQHGTNINGVHIDKPHRLLTATTITTQIITAVSSSQYGGCTITLAHLAPFVDSSRQRYISRFKHIISNVDELNKLVNECVRNEVTDSAQTFVYQVNSMTTTNGQTPFLSVNMDINEVPESMRDDLAMIIEEFLKQRIKGFKNEVGAYITPAFPKLLYVLDENNIHPNSKYYYLTELAAECTAKRMVPDYISAKMMRKLKQGDVYPCMGCRSFLTPDRTNSNYAKTHTYNPNGHNYYGRFNQGVVTLCVPDVALSAKEECERTGEPLLSVFWRTLSERLELCHEALRIRHDRLKRGCSDMAPIMWQHGALARLGKHESVAELLYHGYSTISLGYAGLYECVKALTGKSITSVEGKQLAIDILVMINNACKEWKAAEDVDYSVYGTPIESTTYKFALSLKKRFGNDVFIKLDGHDRNYITNSYHVPVFEHIDPFEKLALESEFQALSPGGAISYVECADLTKNISVVIQIIKFIYDNIMYAELNTKSDYCQKCGFDGEIQIIDRGNKLEWKCPNCGNMDRETLNVARRTCGYIGTNFFNQGRTNEIMDRFVHVDDHDIKEDQH